MNKSEQIVYDCIKRIKPARQSDIVKDTGLGASVVYNALRVLEGIGKVDYKPAKYTAR